MPQKRRSQEEFEAYLKALLNQDYPKIKYQTPDAWQVKVKKSRSD